MSQEASSRVAARRRVGFVGHAVAEYALGAGLIAAGLHLTGGPQAVLVAVGALLVTLNVCTSGRLGAFTLVSRRAHHVADVVLVAALVASPLVALGRLHVLGVLVAELVAFVLFRIERATRYEDPPPPRDAGTRARPAPATPVAAPALANLAGRAGAAAGRGAPQAGRMARRGARNLGVVVGVTRRVARERYGSRRPPSEGPAGSPDA